MPPGPQHPASPRVVGSCPAAVCLLGFLFVAAFAPVNAWSRHGHRTASGTVIYNAHGKSVGRIPNGDLAGTMQGPDTPPIGTVRRRTGLIWDAYLGVGSRARRVGWASGSRPGVGAVALL